MGSAVQNYNNNTAIAVICGTLSLVVVLSFALVVWLLWTKQRCGRFMWPWQWQGQVVADVIATGGPATPATSAGQLKSSAATSRSPSKPGMIAVVVVHPGNQLDLGSPQPSSQGAPRVGAAAEDGSSSGTSAPDAYNPIGVFIAADYTASNESSASRTARSLDSSSRAAETRRAAILAEMEEREAARRELARRSAPYALTPSPGWALSFLPYIV